MVVDLANGQAEDGPIMFSPAEPLSEAAIDLLASARGKRFGTILADPPWQFQNRTGKVAPEHKRLSRAVYPERLP